MMHKQKPALDVVFGVVGSQPDTDTNDTNDNRTNEAHAYIASSSYNRTNVKLLEKLLARRGIVVTSTWAHTPPLPEADTQKVIHNYSIGGNPHYYVRDRARVDFADIDRSDILIMQYPWGAGTASEVAYAIAKRKPVYVLCDETALDDLPLPVGLLHKDSICTSFDILMSRINNGNISPHKKPGY